MATPDNEKERLINAIEELSLLLSEKLWADDEIKDRFVLAGLADGIRVAAVGLRDL
jgi:hypothetical protein